MILRGYQSRIVETCVRENTIVLLPTGAGKTAIAAATLSRRMEEDDALKGLFFVPTIALVAQQAKVMRTWMPKYVVGEYHGDASIPRMFAVLVTTPKAFEAAQLRGEEIFQWKNFSTVIFDEVHHVIKDHPYRSLAKRLLLSPSKTPRRIIGMTASLTYAVGEVKVRAASQKLCSELQISQIEVASEDELRDGGYKGSRVGTVAEVVKQSVELGVQEQLVIPEAERKPHLVHSSLFKRIADGTATQFCKELICCVRAVEQDIKVADPTFSSPLSSCSLISWGVFANRRTKRIPGDSLLETWYEAVRIVVSSWEEGEDLATTFLRMMLPTESTAAAAMPSYYSPATCVLVAKFFAERPTKFERFERLLGVLQEKFDESVKGNFRGIVFVRQRITTHILEHCIKSSSLNHCIRTAIIYSASASATPSLNVTGAQGVKALEEFRTGHCNLLLATSVAEEGIDIPEANVVIRFDHVDTPVSYVQGRGRARQSDSSFVMMEEREDRPAAKLARMEMEQHAVASTFQPQLHSSVSNDAARSAQQNRERGAKATLSEAVSESTALAALNLFTKKTKALCDEGYAAQANSSKSCTLRYMSILREVSGRGEAADKKTAKKRAALSLAKQLMMDIV